MTSVCCTYRLVEVGNDVSQSRSRLLVQCGEDVIVPRVVRCYATQVKQGLCLSKPYVGLGGLKSWKLEWYHMFFHHKDTVRGFWVTNVALAKQETPKDDNTIQLMTGNTWLLYTRMFTHYVLIDAPRNLLSFSCTNIVSGYWHYNIIP